MDTCLICDLGEKLVCCKISILFWKSHVIPGDVFCLENITGFHIGIFKTHCRKVIAKHNNNGILTAAVDCINEVCNKVICVVNHVYIIFPLIIGGFIGSSGYSDLRVLNNLFSWIISMGTNCDRVYKVGLIFGCIHSFYSLIYKNFIGWPASTWCVLGNVH